MKITPHQKIMRAAKKRTGLRLSAEEVWQLSRDQAIQQCASDDERPPICQECNEEMHRYEEAADTGKSGYSCDLCGWSVDD